MHHTITTEPINLYAEQYSSPESPALSELNKETNESIPGAQMLSGHLQGIFLQMLSQMIRPRQILELGTYTGYSAICLAKGLKKGGTLHTVDRDKSIQHIRDKYWEKEGLQNIIQQHIGDAASVIQSMNTTFDLVFIDADKKNYGLYFDLLVEKMPSGAYFLADNVLYSGEVVLPIEQQSNNAKVIDAFNKKIAADDRVEQVILPIRDGVMIIRKK